MTLELIICRADELSAKLEQLLFEKTITININRDAFCLFYWALEVGDGFLWVVPPGIKFSTHWYEPHGGLILSVSAASLAKIVEPLMRGRPVKLKPTNALQDVQTEHLMRALLEEIENPLPIESLLAETLIDAICIRLVRLCATTEIEPASTRCGLPMVRLKRVQEYVCEHIEEQISVSDMAKVPG